MKLYHFCAPQFLDGIQREGLTKGSTPIMEESGDILLISHTQWLTIDGSFKQPWNGMVTVKYDRTAYRISVKVPKDSRRQLLTWPELKAKIGPEKVLPGFDDPEFSGSEDWRIFIGKIPAGWLREVVAKPNSGTGGEVLTEAQP